jgi:hypothetical protein
MVKNGEASWVVLKRSQRSIDTICHLCHADPEVKNCALCGGTGKEATTIIDEDYGNDIVSVSRPPVDKKEKKRSSALAAKTPRVATIESEHLELAYSGSVETQTVKGKKLRVWIQLEPGAKAAQDRIEEYGRLILDARMFVGAERVPCIKSEPENDSRKHEGRDFDFGRAI